MVEQLEFHTLSSNTSAFSPTLSDIDTGSVGTGRRQQVTERDELFYFHETDFISIQVEDRLFKVQRVLLATYSTYFERLIGYMKYGYPKCGSSDDEPLYLDGIAKGDFQCFLVVLQSVYHGRYTNTKEPAAPPPMAGSHVLHDCSRGVVHFKSPEWRTVLRLAKTWNSDCVTERAIAGIDATASSLEKMEIGLEHAVQRWVLAGLQDLITRDVPLTQSEAPWIDATTFNKVARAREHRYKSLIVRLVTDEVERPVCRNCGSDFEGNAWKTAASGLTSPDITWTLMCSVCKPDDHTALTVMDVLDQSSDELDKMVEWRTREDDLDFILRTYFPDLYGEDN